MITATGPSTTTTTTTSNTAAAAAAASSAAAAAAQPGGALGKDEFMKLLIAQMQNQDPMDPMQGDQMAAQLAQFSSLEQLQDINDTLSSQSSSAGTLLGAVQGSAAIATIGHSVLATGNQVQIGGDGGATTVTASLGTPAATATLHIYNSAGAEVGTESLGSANAGKQTFNISAATNGLPAGTYTYSIDGKDSTGAALSVTTYESGVVDGVSTSQNGLVLTSGGLSIPYANVVQILK